MGVTVSNLKPSYDLCLDWDQISFEFEGECHMERLDLNGHPCDEEWSLLTHLDPETFAHVRAQLTKELDVRRNETFVFEVDHDDVESVARGLIAHEGGVSVTLTSMAAARLGVCDTGPKPRRVDIDPGTQRVYYIRWRDREGSGREFKSTLGSSDERYYMLAMADPVPTIIEALLAGHDEINAVDVRWKDCRRMGLELPPSIGLQELRDFIESKIIEWHMCDPPLFAAGREVRVYRDGVAIEELCEIHGADREEAERKEAPPPFGEVPEDESTVAG